MDTVLAFDFGLKRIGVAVGNTGLKQAQPLAVISEASGQSSRSMNGSGTLRTMKRYTLRRSPAGLSGSKRA